MQRYAILSCAIVLSLMSAASGQTMTWTAPNTYGSYTVTSNTWVLINGTGTATFNGLWDASPSNNYKSLWKADGANLYFDAAAQIQNNRQTSGLWLYASNVQWEGNPLNTGASNEVFECAPLFNGDIGSGVIGSITPSTPQPAVNTLAGGFTTLRVHNARLVTHASQNLPTAWKHANDASAWFAAGQTHHSHHGLLIFDDIMNYDGTSSGTEATCSEWYVKTSDQTYDGGLYWKKSWTLNVDADVKLTANTHFEQAAIGVSVGFGSQYGTADTTLNKTGEGALVIARGTGQSYGNNTVLDIQQGRVEFNSDPGAAPCNDYQNNGLVQALKVKVSNGAALDLHAYSYAFDINHKTSASYGQNSLHRLNSLESNGTVKIGGLWSASTCAWDQAYQTTLNGIKAETALAREAKLDVLMDMTLGSESLVQIILGADSAADDYQAIIRGTFTQAGILEIIDDGTLAAGSYDLFDAGTFGGAFAQLMLPASFDGSYNELTGVLDLVLIPEPITMTLLAFGAAALLRRRR